jgi:hypothetical protein
VIGLRTADEETVEYLREAVGTSFKQYTRNSGSDRTSTESEEKEEYLFAKDDLRSFDSDGTVICQQDKGWVHGRIKMIEQ